jgi:cupin superfamily protein
VTLLDIDATAFAPAFAHHSMLVAHDLADHPLLQLDEIAALADRLAPDQVRRERNDLPLENRGYVDAGTGPPSASVLGVEENGFRISLREIQSDPIYRALIDECLDEVAPLVGDREGGMRRRSGYLFVSSPAATTPMHFDPEHSLLLQVRGAKTVWSVPRRDAAAVQRELDHYYDGVACAFSAMQREALRFELAPGRGVYFPSFVPHWVETHAGVSVSFSIPFYTRFSERAEYVNRVNTRLRKLRLTPRPPGASAPVDVAKATLLRSWTRLRRPRGTAVPA